MKTTHSTTIAMAPDAVFAYLSDVSNEAFWRQSIVGSRYVDATAPALGVLGQTDVSMGGRALTMNWNVVEFSADRSVSWRLDGEPWHGGGSYRVSACESGTSLTASLEVRLKGAARLFEPLLGLQLRRGLRTDLARLASVLESSA